MIKRNFLLFIGFILLIAAGLPVQAKEVPVNLRFAGTLIRNIEIETDPSGIGGIATVPKAVFHTQAKGSPGKAVVRGVSTAGAPVFPPPDECVNADPLFIPIVDNPIVFTFKDLSLLFANSEDGGVCLDQITGKTEFIVKLRFIGGRGRFEGATGQAVIEGETAALDLAGILSGDTGTIKGVVILP